MKSRSSIVAFAAAVVSVVAMGFSIVGCERTSTVVVTPPKVEHRHGGTQIVIPINPRHDRRHW